MSGRNGQPIKQPNASTCRLGMSPSSIKLLRCIDTVMEWMCPSVLHNSGQWQAPIDLVVLCMYPLVCNHRVSIWNTWPWTERSTVHSNLPSILRLMRTIMSRCCSSSVCRLSSFSRELVLTRSIILAQVTYRMTNLVQMIIRALQVT